jgi:hypothetical protein
MSSTKATKKVAAPAADKKASASKPKAPAPDAAPATAADAAGVAPAPAVAPEPVTPKALSGTQALAAELIAQADTHAVMRHAAALEDEREGPSSQAARVLQEIAEQKPEMLVPLIERFSRLLVSKNKRVVQTCAAALGPLSRIAPAKVAKQLPLLTQNWEHTTEEGQDGLVRAFAGLCTASVAYQKRLEPALARALGDADPKLLIRWTEIVLPALKGEPHARARAVVEQRLPNIPRPLAQKIADFLGIKLRPLMR